MSDQPLREAVARTLVEYDSGDPETMWDWLDNLERADEVLGVVVDALTRDITALPGTRDFDQHAPGPNAPMVAYVKRADVLAVVEAARGDTA